MNDNLLLPKLRHTRWIGWTEVAGRDLFEKTAVNGLPRVGVGEDTPRRYAFVTPKGLAEDGRSFAELEAIAVANLQKRPASWTVKGTRGGFLGFGKKSTRLEFVDEFACERVLDPMFMKEAARLLGTEMIAVATPVRGVLWAEAGIGSLEEIGAFLALAENGFARVPENMEPVSPVVFTITNGALVGVIQGSPARNAEVTPARGFPWPQRDVTQVPPLVPPGEKPLAPVLEAGDLDKSDSALLRLIGYVPASRSIEFSCILDPGRKIPAHEVARLGRVARASHLPDGRPIDFARVVFLDRPMAETAAEQLAATGAVLAFYDDSGELGQL